MSLLRNLRGWLGLVGCWALIAVTWLWILPQVALLPAMKSRIQRHREAGINAGAMVYTELGEIQGVEFDYENGKPVFRDFQMNSR